MLPSSGTKTNGLLFVDTNVNHSPAELPFKLKVRKACREILAISLLGLLLLPKFLGGKYPDPLHFALLESMLIGIIVAPFIWLLYRFARFVIG
jgi:hypothetical protein